MKTRRLIAISCLLDMILCPLTPCLGRRTFDSSLAIQMSPLKSLTLITRYMRHHETIQTVKECRWAIWWYLASPCSRPHCWLGLSDMHLDLLQVQQKSHFDSLTVSTLFNNETQKQQHCGDQVCCSGERTRGGQSSLRGHDVLCFCSILSESWRINCLPAHQSNCSGVMSCLDQDPSPCSSSRFKRSLRHLSHHFS